MNGQATIDGSGEIDMGWTTSLAVLIISLSATAANVKPDKTTIADLILRADFSLVEKFGQSYGMTNEHRLLEALISTMQDQKLLRSDREFSELNLDTNIKKKIESLKEELVKNKKIEKSGKISFSDLLSILKEKGDSLSQDDIRWLLSLMLVHLEKKNGKAADNDIAFLNVLEKSLSGLVGTEMDKPIHLSEPEKKAVGLGDEKGSDFLPAEILESLERNKNKGVPNHKDIAGIQKKILERGLDSRVADFSPAMTPILDQVANGFNQKAGVEVTDRELYERLQEIVNAGRRARGKKPIEFKSAPESFPETRGGSQQSQSKPRGSHEQGRAGVALPNQSQGRRRTIDNNAGGGTGVGSPGGTNPIGRGTRPSREPLPEGFGQELAQCVEKIRSERRLNLEFSALSPSRGGIGIMHCASTAVGKSSVPLEDGLCSVDLRTATHCVKDFEEGSELTFHGLEKFDVSRSSFSYSDYVSNALVEGKKAIGRDLSQLKVKVDCRNIAAINVVPMYDQTLQHGDPLGVVMLQNARINASGQESNRATIGAIGRANAQGVLEFDSYNGLNDDHGYNSDRIQKGDSGGAALACTKDKNGQLAVKYVGAISFMWQIDGDPNHPENGLTGGVASAVPITRRGQTNGLPRTMIESKWGHRI